MLLKKCMCWGPAARRPESQSTGRAGGKGSLFSEAGTQERKVDVCPKASSSRPLWQPVGQELSQAEGGDTCRNRWSALPVIFRLVSGGLTKVILLFQVQLIFGSRVHGFPFL